MIFYILLALIILVIGIIRARKARNDLQVLSVTLTLTASLCIGVLAFPYYLLYEEDLFVTVLHTIRYGIISIGMNVDGDIVPLLNLTNPIKIIYTVFLYAMYLLGPIAASMFVLSFSKNIVEYFKIKGQRNIHIFSYLNDCSLAICESLKDEDQFVIFCNCHGDDEYLEKKARENHALLIEKDITSIKIRKKRSYEFYVLNDDERQCLLDTGSLCDHLIKEKNYSKENVIVRSFVSNNSNMYIKKFDDKYGDDVYLRYIDEDNSVAIDTLMKNKELLTGLRHREIFIFGATNIARELFDNLLCLLNQPNSTFTIHVFDENVRAFAQKLKHDCPEILNLEFEKYFSLIKEVDAKYDVHFHEVNQDDPAFNDLVGEMRKPNIIYVCGEDDKKNYDAALSIQRYYATFSNSLSYPEIFCLFRDEKLNELLDEKSIQLFGNYAECYNYENIINPSLEEGAKKVHLSYLGKEDASEEEKNELLEQTHFYAYNNQHSSFAAALGLQYHLAYISNMNYDKEDIKIFAKNWLNNQSNIDKLAVSEHQRWNTYQRLKGYQKVDEEQLEKIARDSKGLNLTDKQLLLHPALVEYDELVQRERFVNSLYEKYGLNRKSNYIQLDKDIIKNLLKILGYE